VALLLPGPVFVPVQTFISHRVDPVHMSYEEHAGSACILQLQRNRRFAQAGYASQGGKQGETDDCAGR